MKAVLAQFDVVTAYGWGIKPLWDGLLSGKTAVTSSPPFSTGAVAANPVALIPDLNVPPGSSRARTMITRLLTPLVGKLRPDTALILATTVCEIEQVERSVLQNNPALADLARPDILLNHIKQQLCLRGEAMVLSSACASSSAALTRAAAMIEQGKAGAVLVVSCDAVSEFVYAGFSTLLSLCDTPAKPFDVSRCGLSLGEAAAWALVTADDSRWAGDDAVALLGWASTTDAVHMTAPDRSAGGLSRAIASACSMAQITPARIDFIAAHGTATIYNDAMEMQAFVNSIQKPTPLFSVKGGTGHTLAAAGLVQILIAARAISLRLVPPTVGLIEPDELAKNWAHNQAQPLKKDAIALSSNSGFGGVNTAIVLGRTGSHRSMSKTSADIVAAGWFGENTRGYVSHEKTNNQQSQVTLSIAEMTDLIGRPVKYLSRMTAEARTCLAAASLAMRASDWSSSASVGILGTGYQGCLAADQDFFRDYMAGGQSLGRANLFIYTLPTSALSEVAIALTLTGPTLHVCDDRDPIPAMIRQAKMLIENGEAAGLLCVCSDGPSAICFAVGQGQAIDIDLAVDRSPSSWCDTFAATVPQP